jgi:hypothetical protein
LDAFVEAMPRAVGRTGICPAVSNRSTIDRIAAFILLVASAGAALGLLAPQLGLGIREHFVLYRWLGLSRTDLLAGAALAAATTTIAWIFARNRLIVVARLRTLIVNLPLIGASILLSLLVLEVAVRLIDGVPILAARNWLAERNALLTTQTMNDHDALLGWALKPDQRLYAHAPSSSFTTGPHGIRRNAPDAADAPEGAVLAVGDSFTAGSDVGDRQTWPAHLETLLGWPVANAAVGGWATDQIILRAESLLHALRPSTVIVSFYEGDVSRAGYRVYGGANKPYFTVEKDALVHHNRPVPLYTGRREETSPRMLLASYSYLVRWSADRLGLSDWWERTNVSYVKIDNDPEDVSCRLLRRLGTQLKARGIRLLFVVQYGGHRWPEATRTPAARSIVACAQEAGINTLDLWEDLEEVYRRSFDEYVRLWASYDGRGLFGHMSWDGNRYVAERIAARLAASRSPRYHPPSQARVPSSRTP